METTDQIKRDIEEARERISETTSQIGERIRATFDWRQQVGERPWAAVGLAAGAGFIVGAASARALTGRRRRMASSYGESYTYDRIARDVESQAAERERGGGMGWLQGEAPAAGAGQWAQEQGEWRPEQGEMGARPPSTTGFETTAAKESWRGRGAGDAGRGGPGRAGALTGILASIAASMEPQLREIGRTLADQLRELSQDLIGQGKEAMKTKVSRWRQGGAESRSTAAGGSTPAWQSSASGQTSRSGSSLSSEATGAWSSGSPTAGSGTYGTSTSPGMPDVRETRTPESRESAGAERRTGGSGSSQG